MAEDSCKGSWEAVENVWKMLKSQGKVKKKSGNFKIENEWQLLHCPKRESPESLNTTEFINGEQRPR